MITRCAACTRELPDASEHSQGNINSPYCRYCAPNGILKSYDEILSDTVRFYRKVKGYAEDEAIEAAHRDLDNLPIWQNKR